MYFLIVGSKRLSTCAVEHYQCHGSWWRCCVIISAAAEARWSSCHVNAALLLVDGIHTTADQNRVSIFVRCFYTFFVSRYTLRRLRCVPPKNFARKSADN